MYYNEGLVWHEISPFYVLQMSEEQSFSILCPI